MKKILILGVNGFIGSHLTAAILQKTAWQIYGMDLTSDRLTEHLANERLHFTAGDITANQDWIAQQIKECDVVLPLVAIATPFTYVSDPIKVFELDFEANLKIIRLALLANTRVIFPSTSEVYGMCADQEFAEEESNLVLGPIHKERWIYSCSKQLLDRVIYAYGKHNQLQYTIFRPFNWIGPKQDNVFAAKNGSSRVVTQFISNIIHGDNIQLVDGGKQRRCFTYIDDAIDALLKIITNENGCADGRIFNIGNPNNNVAIFELASAILEQVKTYPAYKAKAEKIQIVTTDSVNYYGSGYQDVAVRVPAIANAAKYLGWQPTTDWRTALHKILDHYLLTENM
jgi:nucleoside-diphosphate-sugar epimerase